MNLKCVAIAIVTFAIDGFAATPPIPKVSKAPAITPSNPIWMASQLPLSRWGYVEEEFFIEGNANTYKALTAPAEVTGTVAYKTRILVRRPADARRYSGNVVLEPIHPGRSTPALATTFRWIYGNGDVWVGVEPPGNISFLQQFNPARYESLTPVPNLTVHDSLAQVSALLQSPSNPIAGLQVRDVFMQGISATCGVVSQFINMLHANTTLPNGKPIVSGYMPGECSASLPDINVPIIRINTQYDFNAKTRKPDSDHPSGRYRLYELTGSAHFSTNNPLFGVPVPVLRAMGITGTTGDTITCKEFTAPIYAMLNDFPVWVFFGGAMKNLQDWVQKGKAPPRAQPLVTDAEGKPVLDEFGNAKGGLRSPMVDSPTASWHAIGTGCNLWGYKVPFTAEALKKLYPTREAYVRQVKQQTDQLVKGGWITEAEGKYLITAAEKSSIPEPENPFLAPMQPFYPYETQ
jgi:hypothetical protein